MLRIVTEDMHCPRCKKELRMNALGNWSCACGEEWKEGFYMASRDLDTLLKLLQDSSEDVVNG